MIIQQINPKKFSAPTAEQKKIVQEKIKALRKEEDTLIKGMFEFPDAPGGWIEFDYRFLPGAITKIKITHGEIVTIPMNLAKHLNNTYKKVRTSAEQRDDTGNLLKAATVMKYSRTRFIQMDMMDDPMKIEKSVLST